MTTNTQAVELLRTALEVAHNALVDASISTANDYEPQIIKIEDAIKAAKSIEASASEPVKYEQRMRAPNGNCGPWHETSAEMHARYSANPDIGDGFSYERRVLFTAPVSQESHASQSASVEDAWISVADRLPEKREKTRQVLTFAVKCYDDKSSYPGEGIKAVQQDWVVWCWPQNFTHWCEIPPAIAAMTKEPT